MYYLTLLLTVSTKTPKKFKYLQISTAIYETNKLETSRELV